MAIFPGVEGWQKAGFTEADEFLSAQDSKASTAGQTLIAANRKARE
jgi:hypothetical protein